MLDPGSLSAFAETFVGYGNPDAPLWFIGLEEACGPNEAEMQQRLAVWQAFGRPRWMDACDFHMQAGMGHLFDTENCELQKTWKALMRICMKVANPNAVTTTAALQQFQSQRLGRPDGGHCLAELRPLPCPSTRPEKFPYPDWTDAQALPWLHDPTGVGDRRLARRQYEDFITPRRIAQLQALLQHHSPRAVVIYAMTPVRVWAQLAPKASLDQDKNRIAIHRGSNGADYHIRQATTPDGTLYVMMRHPGRYYSHEYQDAVAERLRDHLMGAA